MLKIDFFYYITVVYEGNKLLDAVHYSDITMV